MTPARDQDERVAQQHHRIEVPRQRPQMRDRDVDLPTIELFGGFDAGHRRQAQRRIWGLSGKPLGEAADQCHLGVFGHAGGKDTSASCRIEAVAEVERRLDMLDRSRNQRGDLPRASGWLHAIRGADKQIVGKEVS